MESDPTLYGACMRLLRDYLEAGNSKSALAERLGVPPQHISQILGEGGRYVNIQNLDHFIRTSESRSVSQLLTQLLGIAARMEADAKIKSEAFAAMHTATFDLAPGQPVPTPERSQPFAKEREGPPSVRTRVRRAKKRRA